MPANGGIRRPENTPERDRRSRRETARSRERRQKSPERRESSRTPQKRSKTDRKSSREEASSKDSAGNAGKSRDGWSVASKTGKDDSKPAGSVKKSCGPSKATDTPVRLEDRVLEPLKVQDVDEKTEFVDFAGQTLPLTDRLEGLVKSQYSYRLKYEQEKVTNELLLKSNTCLQGQIDDLKKELEAKGTELAKERTMTGNLRDKIDTLESEMQDLEEDMEEAEDDI